MSLTDLQAIAIDAKQPDRPKLEPWGDGWRATWHPNITIEIQGIRESNREGVHGETIAAVAGQRLEWDLHLNLGSARTRDAFAKRVKESYPDFDWAGALRLACEAVIEASRMGSPLVELDGKPRRTKPEYLIDPLLPKGQTTIIFADGSSGKSFLGLWLAASLATGAQMPGGLVGATPCRTLYLDWECDSEDHNQRLRRMLMGLPPLPPGLLHHRSMQRALMDDLAATKKFLSQTQAELIVIDSLGWAINGDMTDAAIVIPLMNALRALPATKLCVTHVTGAGAKSKSAGSPFGSRFFFNGARTIWEYRHKVTEGHFGLYCRKNNLGKRHAPVGLSVEFDDPDGPITYYGSDVPDDVGQEASLADRAARLLSSGALSTPVLAEELRKPQGTVRTILGRHKDRFRLLDAGGGRGRASVWELIPPQGEQASLD